MISNKKACMAVFVKIIFFIAGSVILAFGLFNIHTQSQITEGGVLGLSLLMYHWLRLSPGITITVFSILLYLLGYRQFGKKFFFTAVSTSILFSISYSIFERIGYLIPDLSNSPLLAAVLGGLSVGVGCGLVVSAGGASGGDDVLALLVSKKTKWPLAIAYLSMDVLVLLLSLSYIPFNKILYSLLTVTISSVLVGRMEKLYTLCCPKLSHALSGQSVSQNASS